METLSKTYGFTPTQIKQEEYGDIAQYLQIIRARSEIKKEEYRREERKRKNRASRFPQGR